MINATVISKNNSQYWDCPDGPGIVDNLPCGDLVAELIGEFWAVPNKGDGIWSGYRLLKGAADAPPTFDSVRVVRVRDKISGNIYVAVGTVAEYLASCGVCCGDAPIAMPSAIPIVIPETTVCKNDDGDCVSVFTGPALAGGQEYKIQVAVGGTLYKHGAGGTFASMAAAVIYANANWAAAGVWSSPNATTLVLTSADNCSAGASILAVAP